MKKILLIAINARYSHSNLALRSIRNFVKDLEYTIVIHEFSVNLPDKDIVPVLKSDAPDAVAFSVYIWNVEKIKGIIKDIKAVLPGVTIILGGPEVSYNADSWISSYPEIDYIVSGPGEAGFRYLLEHTIKAPERIIEIPNPHFSLIPFPYLEEDFASLAHRYIYYESSRGCPFRCTYCLSSRQDQALEFRDADTVLGEIAFIMKHGPDYIKFVDRSFNAERERSRAVWKRLIERYRGSETSFHFEIHPGLLEEEDFAVLDRCPEKLFQFEIGIQSTHAPALEAVKRPLYWDSIKPRLEKLTAMKNIRVHVDLIAGLPTEDRESLARSFNDVYALRAGHFQLGFLKVLPGTEMAERAVELGIRYSPAAPYQVYETSRLSKNDIELFETAAGAVEHLYNSRRFMATLENLEKKYPSPWDLFCDIAEIKKSMRDTRWHAQWEDNAGTLLQLIRLRFPEKEPFFLDCIRWDWCSFSKTNRYPMLFNNEETAQWKRAGYARLSAFSKEDMIDFQGVSFQHNLVKKSRYFRPATEAFKKQYMYDKSIALFLPGSNKAILFDPDGV